MSIPLTMTGDFLIDLKALLPRLRVYALSLTRDRDRADDLVQETVVKSLAGQHSFRPGTNFAAWLFRIQRNEFISGLRRQRPTVPLDDVIANALSHAPAQENGLIMREFTASLSPSLGLPARSPASLGARRTGPTNRLPNLPACRSAPSRAGLARPGHPEADPDAATSRPGTTWPSMMPTHFRSAASPSLRPRSAAIVA